MAYAGNRIVMEMRQNLFAHIQRLPVAFFDRTRSGDLTSHLSNDVSQLQQTLTDDLVRLVGNLITLVCGITLAIVIDWRLTGIVVFLLLLVMSFFVVNGKRLRVLNRASLDALSEAMGTMTEAFANIRLVKAFAREAHEDARAGERLGRVFALSMKGSYIEGAFGTVAFSGFILVLLGVIWYGGHNVLNGSLSAGSLVAFLLTITIISGPMGSLAVQYARLQRAIGAADRLFALLDDAPETADAPDAVGFPEGPGHVVFDSVDFAYTPDTPVLCGLSLDVPPGQVTALVGPSGSGKTTLAALLYRFYEVDGGHIRIDGVNVTDIRRERPARTYWPRSARPGAVQRHAARQHPLWQTHRNGRGSGGSGTRGERGRVRNAVPTRLRHHDRGAGRHAVGWAAAARGDCPRRTEKPAHSDFG